MLDKLGYEFHSVENGKEALDAVTGGVGFALVLMDCRMPVMDGFEATQQNRGWEREHGKPRLPIVALTAGAFQDDHDHCLAVGMDDYLAKPVDFSTLAAMLEKWCGSTG